MRCFSYWATKHPWKHQKNSIFLLSHPAVCDCSEKQWRNWRSCSQCQDATFLPLGLPAQVISCDCCCIHGNEPLQTPSTRAPLTGWLACMDEVWALPWLVLSAPGMGSSSPLQKTQLAVCPPPSHAHACWIPHDCTRLTGPGDHAPVRWMSVPAMSHWITCNDGIFLSWISKSAKEVFLGHFGPAIKTDNILCHHISSGLSGWAPFLYFPYPFCKSCVLRGRLTKTSAGKKNILCTDPSAVTSALSFDSPPPLSQPSSPDKKEPLLRCFARHYKTVAMDTQSEQAPHTGSRIGNDRCNISRLKKIAFSLVSTQADGPLCCKCQRSRPWKEVC